MARAVLSKSRYKVLIKDITDIYIKAQAQSKHQVNLIITEAYWQIGAHIVDIEQSQKSRASYGDQLLEHVSQDLTDSLGSGFSVTNLKYMRQFYLSYPKGQTRDKLPWTHYRSLLSIKDPQLRTYYTKQAAENKWSTRDLDRFLKLDKVERQRIASQRNHKQTAKVKTDLPVMRGSLYMYALSNSPLGQIIKSPLMIDCGFRIFKEMTYKKIGPLKSGDVVSCKKIDSGYVLRKNDLSASEIYVFKAIIERVVDGDTLLCLIDVGFKNFTRQRLRLRNINAPELNTPRGQKAKQFIVETLRHCEFVIVKTYRSDKYDRFLADVFYLNGVKYPHVVAEEGRLLNQDLVENHLAVIV